MTTATTQIEAVTAENVVRLFPDVNSSLARTHNDSTSTRDELEGYDEEQIRLMEEVCIVLDTDDNPIGTGSKKTCKSPSLPPTQITQAFPTVPPISHICTLHYTESSSTQATL